MARRLVIAVDCDDVLLSTAEAIVANYNQRFGTQVTLKDMYKPATIETWGTDDDDIAIERVNEFLRSNEHASLRPTPSAIAGIKELAEYHELHLITGRADFLKDTTKSLLQTYFPDCFTSIEHTNYILPSTSKAVRRSKGDVCAEIGANILIDDHLVHGVAALDARLEKVIVFGEYPWNSEVELSEGMVRCKNWEAVTEELRSYAS